MVRVVRFQVDCPDIAFGCHVRVVGSDPALGTWDPAAGLELFTTPADFPVWATRAPVRIDDDRAEFKYVICQRNPTLSAVRWEETPNRTLGWPELLAGDSAPTGASLESHRFNDVDAKSLGRSGSPVLTASTSDGSSQSFCSSGFSASRTPESEGHPAGWSEQMETVGLSEAFERHYSLVGNKPISQGSFGVVWRCRDKAGGKDCVGKVVRKPRSVAQGRDFLLGEDDEVHIHAMLQHTNIVELFEYFAEEDTATLVMEYCAGGDLLEAICRSLRCFGRALSERQAAVATEHTLRALAYLHHLCIVHRDVKGENILLSSAGVPLEDNIFKLCDFGFAAHDNGDGLQDRLGSPDTVAPEVVAGLRYSCPADMWSLGATVYMMLAGAPPFEGRTDKEVLRQVMKGSYSLQRGPWDAVSAPAKHLVASLLVVEAQHRPTARTALGEAWFQARASRATGA